MEITEALQKEVEAFLFNEFNIEIYDRKKMNGRIYLIN